MIPRGIRNCNPLNIRRSKDQWQGLLPVQNDKSFYQFKAMEWGYRAAFRLLRTYRVKYHRTTIRTIIERCFILNIGSLQDDDAYWACELVRAMALVENGVGCADLIRREEIRKGYELAFG